MAWFPKHPASHTVKRVQAVIDALKEKGVKEFAAVGYCYGVRLVFDLAFAGQIKVAGGSHPSLLELADFDRFATLDVPLILMTSFNTHEDTLRIIKKYANQQLRITTFNQSRYPRIYKESLLPCPKSADDDKKNWYPPGHGDLYNALYQSGVLDQLLAEGKEYLFVSNSDNLGAV